MTASEPGRDGPVTVLNEQLVGDVRYFDAAGELVPSDLDGRVVGISAGTLRRVPHRVGFAGGAAKHAAIHAALTGGWINVLITDIDTAEALRR